jgi:hypothetical protein
MPQGDRRGEVDLYDFTYDGIVYENFLSNGMGQLTDENDRCKVSNLFKLEDYFNWFISDNGIVFPSHPIVSFNAQMFV